MTIVTDTFWRLASASAPATIVLIAARSRYFLEGKSEAVSVPARQSATSNALNMGGMVSMGCRFSKSKRKQDTRLMSGIRNDRTLLTPIRR